MGVLLASADKTNYTVFSSQLVLLWGFSIFFFSSSLILIPSRIKFLPQIRNAATIRRRQRRIERRHRRKSVEPTRQQQQQ